MNKFIIISSAAFMMVSAFTACNSSGANAKEDAAELNAYVDSVQKIEPEYTASRWEAIEAGYRERVNEVDSSIESLDEATKSAVAESKKEFADLEQKYKTEIREKETAASSKQVLRNALFGEGKIGEDMQFSWVTAANIADVYERFVSTVADNKDKYSREDWDQIKVLYEALDTRKNEVEKDLPGKDNLKIAKQKVRFSAIKTIHRPLAKAEENAEAKKQ